MNLLFQSIRLRRGPPVRVPFRTLRRYLRPNSELAEVVTVLGLSTGAR